MAAFMLIVLILLMLGSNEAIGYYYGNCQERDIFDCLLNGLDEPEEEVDSVTVTGVYDFKGYTVNVSANIPLAGGAVTGSVSGTCEGMIRGTYDGKQNGVISGTMTGVCSPFFVNIPASADFTGSVNKSGKTVPFTFTGKGGGFTHQGSMTLVFP